MTICNPDPEQASGSASSQRIRWSSLLILCALALGLGQAQACHQFQVCHDGGCGASELVAGNSVTGADTGGDTANGGTGNGGGGGHHPNGGGASPAGAAGASEGGGAACATFWGDCDDSTLNGCEADLTTDIENCGACGARCVGICDLGRCHAFVPVTTNVDVLEKAGIAFTSDHVYCLSDEFSSGTKSLIRAAKNLTGQENVISQGPDARVLIPGVDRIYLAPSQDETLYSVLLTGGPLQHETLALSSAALADSWLYYEDGKGQVFRRGELDHVVQKLPAVPQRSNQDSLQLAASASGVALVRSSSDDNLLYSYYVYELDDVGKPSSWKFVTNGTGDPTRVRRTNEGIYLVADLDAAPSELRQVGFDGKTRVLAALPEIVDFAIYANAVYVSWAGQGEAAGLRLISLRDPISGMLDYPTAGALRSLETDGQYLYFGDPLRKNLSRVPFWIQAE